VGDVVGGEDAFGSAAEGIKPEEGVELAGRFDSSEFWTGGPV